MKKGFIFTTFAGIAVLVSGLHAEPSCKEEEVVAQQSLETLSSDWKEVGEKTKNAVVLVHSYNGVSDIFEPYKTPEQAVNNGSGFFINEDGYLLTNFHVIEYANVGVCIEIPKLGKEQFDAEIIRCRPDKDVALLRLTPQALLDLKDQLGGPIPYLSLGDSDTVSKTQEVMCLGFPLSDEGLKITRGDISGKERIEGQHYIQVTAPLNFGNSGGPIVDSQGKVIGIATRGISRAQNTGYAIPITEVTSLLDVIEEPLDEIIEKRPCWGIARACKTTKEYYDYFKTYCNGGIDVNE